MTLRQRANPLSSWVESCCSVMVVFVFVVSCRSREKRVCVKLRILTPLLDLSRTHSQSSQSSHLHHSYHLYHSYHQNFPNFLRVYPQDFLLLVCPQPVTSFDEISLKFSCSLSAVSQSILLTQMQICSTSRRLINFECCRVCPWISMQSSRLRASRRWLCCEHFRLFSECQDSKELVNHNGCGCVSA